MMGQMISMRRARRERTKLEPLIHLASVLAVWISMTALCLTITSAIVLLLCVLRLGDE